MRKTVGRITRGFEASFLCYTFFMRSSFEGQFSKGVERREIIDKAYALAQEIIKRTQIEETDFSGIYSPEEIAKDRGYVARRAAEFKKDLEKIETNPENPKLGVIFEAIVVAAREWFGKNAQMIKTSKYDDVANGIDVIAELPKKEKNYAGEVGLAVDVTFSNEFEDEIDRIKKEIEEGKLPKIKYFESRQRKKGSIPDVVRVIVCASKETVMKLAETLLTALKNPRNLFEHQFQFQALDEIIFQLRAFEEYARLLGKNDLAERYKKNLTLMRVVKKERLETVTDQHERDLMVDRLEDYLSSSLKTGEN